MTIAVIGVLFYAAHGIFAMVQEGNFLDYTKLDSILPGDAIMARYHSMLGVEIGVLLTVSSIMFAIYANLASRGGLTKGM